MEGAPNNRKVKAEMAELDAAKIPHVKGQEGRIDNQDKAQKMAEISNMYEQRALNLKEFMAGNREDLRQTYGWYAEAGVTPEYIKARGDIAAESEGAAYDYSLEAAEKMVPQLKLDMDMFTEELLQEENKGMLRSKGLNTDKENIRLYGEFNTEASLVPELVIKFERLNRLVLKRRIALEELKRRGKEY